MDQVSAEEAEWEQLGPDETELRGRWIMQDGRMIEDATAKRIRFLVAHELTLVSRSVDGWNRGYRDDRDGRLWEFSFPQSEMQGGGPPLLRLTQV